MNTRSTNNLVITRMRMTSVFQLVKYCAVNFPCQDSKLPTIRYSFHNYDDSGTVDHAGSMKMKMGCLLLTFSDICFIS